MKITQSNRDRLVIKDFPWAFGLIFFLMGGAVFYLGVKGLIYNKGADKAIGVCAFVGLLFLLAGAVFTKRSVFVFDLAGQQLTWSRLSLFGWKGGILSLGRITGCVVQVLEGEREAPTYRLVLASPDGDLPLSEAYSTGSVVDRMKMREAIHTALGLPAPDPETTASTPGSPPSVDDQVKQLIDGGQIIAAIKMIRDQRGCSLAEAKEVADSMKSN